MFHDAAESVCSILSVFRPIQCRVRSAYVPPTVSSRKETFKRVSLLPQWRPSIAASAGEPFGERFGAAQIDQAKADRVLSSVGREVGRFVKDAWAKHKIANGGMKQHRKVRFAETGATGWAIHACVYSQWQSIVEAVRWNEGAAINDLDLHHGVANRTLSLV